MALESLTPDKHQLPIIQMSTDRTAVVKGVAGSGKSYILLMKAKQVSTFTDSYAIVVYTKSLKQFFVDELNEIGQSQGHVFYFEEWKRSNKGSFTYLFVDECQDFNAEEIKDFTSHGQYCWFFGDTDQSIMKFPEKRDSQGNIIQPAHDVQSVEETAKQLGVHPQDLCINHRLTIENAKVGEYIYPVTHLSLACIKHGQKPKLEQIVPATRDSRDYANKIAEYLQKGNLTDVGILTYYKGQVGLIKELLLSKGIPVEFKTDDEMHIDFKSTNPKIINFHCAKGLQFADVFIPYCDKFSKEYEKAALYVAVTRPLDRLYLISAGRPCDFLPPADSDIYVGNAQQNNGPF